MQRHRSQLAVDRFDVIAMDWMSHAFAEHFLSDLPSRMEFLKVTGDAKVLGASFTTINGQADVKIRLACRVLAVEVGLPNKIVEIPVQIEEEAGLRG